MSAFETIAIKDISSGNDLIITAAGAAKVDGSAVVQPVSGTVTIVPSGTQDVNIVNSIAIAVTGPLTDAQLRATPVPVSSTNLDIRDLVFASDKVDVTGSSISISSSALPTGAATEASLLTIIGHVDGVEPLLTAIEADTTILAGTVVAGKVQVDIVTMPAVTISGSIDTELPTPAILTDNTANPTVPSVGVFPHIYDGSTWDRMPGNSADGLLVNLGANNDVSVTSSALPTGAATAANQATIIGHIDGIEPLLGTIDADTSNISTKIDTIAGAVAGSEMQVDIVASLPAGTNNIGDVDVLTMPGTAAEASALPSLLVVVAGDDGTDTHPLQLSASGDLKITMDGEAVVLGAGSASIGILGANSGVDIGDVTINNGAGANAVNIQDGGNSITVDNNGTFAVQAAQSGTWSVRAQDGSGNALTSAARGSERALSVQLVDAAGNQITSFGGGTQYTEDAPAAADPVGNMSIAVRADTLGAVTSNDGDNIAIRATNKGELYVKHVDSIPVTDNGGSLTVDNNGTFVVQINGAALTALELLDDVVYTDDTSTHSTGNSKGVGIMAAATPTDASVNANDIGMVAMTLDRKLHVSVQDALPAGSNAIGNVGHGKTLKTVTSGVTAITADTDIVAAVPTKRIKVVGYAFFTDSTTQNVLVLKSNGTAGTALWTVPLQSPAAGSVFGANLSTAAPGFLFATVAGEKLTLDVSAAVNVWYSITYYDDDVS